MPTKHRKLPVLTPQEAAHFWSRIDKSPGNGPWGNCWLRIGATCASVRSVFFIRSRMAYYLATGDDPGTMEVCHHCDVRECCNPAHLFKGTHADNMRDCLNKGRMATGFNHGTHTHPNSRTIGERSARAILSEYDVRSILNLLKRGATQREIGILFGVSRNTIASIARGDNWKHIPRP